MISFSKNLKLNRGMTYIELIVVLAIFATMTSIIMYNYGEFQAKIDIKVLASDIALKILEAQKSAVSGNNPDLFGGNKPSYGVYFDTSENNKQFYYFSDSDGTVGYSDPTERLETIDITKNNYISTIDECADTSCNSPTAINIHPLSITFTRPDSKAVFTQALEDNSDYIRITVVSPKGPSAKIKVYPSGRIQVN